ncbi:MAG: oxidoreductase [Candidatus Humimicrobiaceae bacterium]
MSLENLFSPIKIGNVEIPNRAAMAPMNIGAPMYSDDGMWPKKTIRYYEERAIGGLGLIITQFIRVYDKIGSYPIAGLHDDRFIPSHAELVERIHKHGTKIFHQIALMGGKIHTGPGAAPTSMYSPVYIYKPRALTTDELDMLVGCFIDAAGRGIQAGYDGTEVHAGHLYLIGAMISPATNKRTDKYGGSFEARMKFITDIIKGIRSKYPKYNIGVKFSAYEELEGGIDIELGKKIAKYISGLGVDYLHVSTESTTLGVFSKLAPVPTMYQPRNTLVPLAAEIKKICPDQVIIATGSITVPEEADTFIKEGKCDMVALGRTIIADPHWAKNAKEGKPVTPCIRCMACYNKLLTGEMLCCSMNPYMLHESEQDLPIPSKIKNVIVIGAGPAGIRAALTASKRGHRVTLYEKMPYIGGMIYPGSRPEFKKDVARAIDYFDKMLKSSNVNLVLNTEVTPELVEKVSPDSLVIAIGAKPIMPEIPAINSSKVASAIEVLRDISKFKKGKAVVIGGGEVGCEAACYMADNGFDVSIVEILPGLLEENNDNNLKLSLLNLIKGKNIKVFTETKPNKVVEEGLEVILPNGKEGLAEADVIAVAINQKPENDLIKELALKAEEFYVIGDCNNVGRIRDAVSEGERVGRWI